MWSKLFVVLLLAAVVFGGRKNRGPKVTCHSCDFDLKSYTKAPSAYQLADGITKCFGDPGNTIRSRQYPPESKDRMACFVRITMNGTSEPIIQIKRNSDIQNADKFSPECDDLSKFSAPQLDANGNYIQECYCEKDLCNSVILVVPTSPTK